MAKNDKITVPTPLLAVLTILPVLILIFASLALLSKTKTPPLTEKTEENFSLPQTDPSRDIATQEVRLRENANIAFEQMQRQTEDLVQRQQAQRDFDRTFR